MSTGNIIYRAKHLRKGEWVSGIPWESIEEPYLESVMIVGLEWAGDNDRDGRRGCYVFEVDPKTISQYIGCKDKDGRMIFEGDIVETKYGKICLVVRRKEQHICGFDLFPLESPHKGPTSYDVWLSKNLKVIGNMWDNPEYFDDLPSTIIDLCLKNEF